MARQHLHRRRLQDCCHAQQCGVGEGARGCPWSSSRKVEAARCAAAHSEEHSPTCDPSPDHITPPLVERRQTVHALAPHGEGPRRVSCTERLGPVSYMLCAGPDNRSTHRKPPVRRDSASPRSTCPGPLFDCSVCTLQLQRAGSPDAEDTLSPRPGR